MAEEDRSARIAATLERHLQSCDAVVAACFEGRTPEDMLQEWPLKRMLNLMKVSTQLAQAISRIHALAPKIAKSEV
jgi:hypothetical protein